MHLKIKLYNVTEMPFTMNVDQVVKKHVLIYIQILQFELYLDLSVHRGITKKVMFPISPIMIVLN